MAFADVIAIDGPAGSGKSTVARMLADTLGYTYVDTGAIYRCVALAASKSGIHADQEEKLAELASKLDIRFSGPAGEQRILLDGRDVSESIRTPEISDLASRISALPAVRQALLELQRQQARGNRGAVLEGRDIGTVVFPNARHKFFLTATPEERARRRYRELVNKGLDVTLEEVLKEQEVRDSRDRTRKQAPLVKADDAFEVDTTGLTVEDVVALLKDRIFGDLEHAD